MAIQEMETLCETLADEILYLDWVFFFDPGYQKRERMYLAVARILLLQSAVQKLKNLAVRPSDLSLKPEKV